MLNKANLVSKVAEETGETKASTERFIAALQKVVVETVADGEEVRLTGFASFAPAHRAARKMKNPRTGEDILVPAKKTIKIRPLKYFIDTVRAK